MSRSSPYPLSSDRLGWHRVYARQHDRWVKAGDEHNAKVAAHLALWYLFLHISESEQ